MSVADRGWLGGDSRPGVHLGHQLHDSHAGLGVACEDGCTIGEAPLHRGNKDPCTFTQPRRGMASTALGSSFPYAATTKTSASNDASCASRLLASESGWNAGMPSSGAASLTSGNVDLLPALPACRAG